MKEVAQEVLAYLGGSWTVSAALALVAGFAGNKTVSYEWRSGLLAHLLTGSAGLFLGEFVLFSFGLQEYLEPISEFRLLFDLVAAYIGSFLVAALVHFVRPM